MICWTASKPGFLKNDVIPTGTITMALLENLKPGHVYLVKVSASNNVGDGPFSNVVELSVRADLSSGHDPQLSRGSTYSTGQLIF